MDLPDFREPLFQAQDWTHHLISGITPDQLDLPTPCEDWDVKGLVAHLYLVAERIAVLGRGGNALAVTQDLVEVGDDLAGGFAERIKAAREAWQDDTTLTQVVTVPWGTFPGAVALAGYLPENLAHGWDIAVATGQPSEADPELATLALSAAQRGIPAERDGFPFGPVVESGPDDSPTTRFVHWMGRAGAGRVVPVGAE